MARRDDISDTDFGRIDPPPPPHVNPRREARKSIVWIGAGAVSANLIGPVAGDLWSWVKLLAAAVYEHLHISASWH